MRAREKRGAGEGGGRRRRKREDGSSCRLNAGERYDGVALLRFVYGSEGHLTPLTSVPNRGRKSMYIQDITEFSVSLSWPS